MIMWGDKMKYTRYDLKKKNKNKNAVFFMFFIGMLLTALLFGTILSNLFIKNSGKTPVAGSSKQPKTSDDKNQKVSHSPIKFLIIQSGFYSSKEGAIEQNDKLKQVVNPFMVEEDGKFKVLAGIYTEQDCDGIVKKINEKSLDNFKITYEIGIDDQSAYELAEIIKAHLQHLTQLTNPNVASVNTESFKTWLSKLPSVEKSSKNYGLLEEYKKYVNSLPDKLGKEKSAENYNYIYNILKKIGNKK